MGIEKMSMGIIGRATLVSLAMLSWNPTPAQADRCSALIANYNSLNSEYARAFNSQGRPCTNAYWASYERMLDYTKKKLSVSRQLDDTGCRSQMTGGNTSEQLTKSIAEHPSQMGEIKAFCDQLEALKKPTTKGSEAANDGSKCIDIQSIGKAQYKAVNQCGCKVNFVVETMENHPKQKVQEKLYVENRSTEGPIFSHWAYRPVVISESKTNCK